MGDLQLLLVDINPALIRAWDEAFAGLPNVQTILGRFENVPDWDAIVAPGNSFGIMDGGLDKAIVDWYAASGCTDLQSRLQAGINQFHNGELPVGRALTVNPYRRPWVVYAPTMRIPMDIRGTENVYLAMKAALESFQQSRDFMSRPLDTLLVPGLGMGTGRVSHESGARQMAAAYDHWLHPPRLSWDVAVRRHQRIRAAVEA